MTPNRCDNSVIVQARVRVQAIDPEPGTPSLPVRARPVLSIVVPLFNEQETLPILYRRLSSTVARCGIDSEFLFVDDGSTDLTAGLLDELAAQDPRILVIHLSRNFGHQAAVTAGLDLARGEAVVVMDGDLQDPPELLPRLLAEWRNGAEVVYAIRTQRKEGLLFRLGYWAFYRLLHRLADQEIPRDAGDFCLMDRSVVEAIRQFPERDRFVRGLRAYVGFRQVGLPYERYARLAGTPKYTLRKLAALAIDGLFDFSGWPLRAVAISGALTMLLGLMLSGITVIDAITRLAEPRFAWLLLSALALTTGMQLLALGILGEYLRRIFREVKGRPSYICRSVVGQLLTQSSASVDTVESAEEQLCRSAFPHPYQPR